MKLTEYIKGLQDLLEEHGDLDCYYAIDDEGNSYQKVNYNGELRYLLPEEKDDYSVEHLYGEDEFDYLKEEDDYDDEDIANLIKVCLIN